LCANIAKRKPGISEIEFVRAIELQKGNGIVSDYDEEAIHITIEVKPIREIPKSGLKDRLSRLKKKTSIALTRYRDFAP
jgi:hypothetical protein